MKGRIPFFRLCVALVVCFVTIAVCAQQGTQVLDGGSAADDGTLQLPNWTYEAYIGKARPLTATIVGADPSVKNNQKPTVIDAYLIFVTLQITKNKIPYIFDPTRENNCPESTDLNGTPRSVELLAELSPLFQFLDYTIQKGDENPENGLPPNTGTQYADYFERANFWRAGYWDPTKGTSWQTLLRTFVIDKASYGRANLGNVGGGVRTQGLCIANGVNPGQAAEFIDLDNFWDPEARDIIKDLKTKKVFGANAIPIFIFDSVEFFDNQNNIIAGYHSSYVDKNDNNNIQTYIVADFDSSGLLMNSAPDAVVLSHEIPEWMNNSVVSTPKAGQSQGGNLVHPAWGNGIGQVPAGTCQDDLEVGDPLSQTWKNAWNSYPALNFIPAVVEANLPPPIGKFAYQYHLQELAFISWFYRLDPSVAVNGWYTNNNGQTKNIYAPGCVGPPGPPGG